MKQSEIYRQNAENRAYLAEGALNEPTRQRILVENPTAVYGFAKSN
jgi:hypothetical protein